MLSTIIPQSKRIFLFLLIGFLFYNVYQNREADDSTFEGLESAVAVPGSSIKKFFIDKEGNEIPLFDDGTLYPKPGGGYCNMTPIKDKEMYFQALENPTVQCQNMPRISGYRVCLDGFKNKGECVVLSFGISYEFQYEDLMVDKFGCQAYSFDPTMDKGKVSHVRKGGKDKFYEIGLSSFEGVKTIDYIKRKDCICKVDRYVNIVKMLGLTEKEIDFLKIDIEGSELDFFLDTASNNPELLENVRQIHLEFHNLEKCCDYHSGNSRSTTQIDMMKIVQILHCHGFALAHTQMNKSVKYIVFWYNGKKRSLAYATTWIKIS